MFDSNLIFFLTFAMSLRILFQETAGESTIEGLVKNSKRKLTNNLTCYQCHSEKTSECLNMTIGDEEDYEKLVAPCDLHETVCMVKRISFTTSTGNAPNSTSPMKIVSLKRSCAPKCEPGCLIMGERTRLYFCSTCCTSSNCNVGNTGSKQIPNVYYQLFPILFAISSVFKIHS